MSTTETQTQQQPIISEEIVKTTESNRMVGQVKWFNNKVGFGFITMKESDNTDKDIFVHYSTINVSDTQYRYLVQGEYVEFDLTTSRKPPHEYQSSNISGIKGGKLMCETRQLNRPVKKDHENRMSSDKSSRHTDPSDKSSRHTDPSDKSSRSGKRDPSGPQRLNPSTPTYKDTVDKEGFQMVRKRKN